MSADRHVVPFMEGIVLSYVFILMAVELAIRYLFPRLTGENKRGVVRSDRYVRHPLRVGSSYY